MVLPSAHSVIHKAVGCMLYDERLRGRFHSLKTVRSLANQIAPDGLVMKFDKVYRAFAISDVVKFQITWLLPPVNLILYN
jgi:hypothetical protein